MHITQDLEPSQSVSDHEQQHLTPEQKMMEEAQGLDYWTTEAPAVLEAAEARAATLPTGVPTPPWAAALADRSVSMLVESETFGTRLHEQTKKLLEGQVSTDQVDRWYRSLGPTNDAEDLVPLMLTMAGKLEALPQDPENSRVIASLVHDAALRTDHDANRASLLRYAIKHYEIGEQAGIYDAEGRAAIRQRLDCQHQLLRQLLKDQEITEPEFYRQYEYLQLESINKFREVIPMRRGDAVIGEQLEWAANIFLRHRYWSDETAEDYDVRSAMPREDRPRYPWGGKLTTTPIWSADTVISHDGDESSVRLQFKTADIPSDDPRYRMYLPTEVTLVESRIKPRNLQNLLLSSLGAIKATYDGMHQPHLAQDIDEKALRVMGKILDVAA